MDSSAVPQFLAQGDFLGLPQFEKSMICLKMTKKNCDLYFRHFTNEFYFESY